MYWFLFIILLIVATIFLLKFSFKIRAKFATRKVVKLSLNRNRNAVNKQTCSFCRKKAKRLAFYAAENGQVIGVCDHCRPQAERRALMRL
jgi:hypothetical protein